nr:reverse transcriptase domain-containing protein [Tanacetum cinerariifolium]
IKNQLENALKEKDDLKLKLEEFETSSKNLTKLINSRISAIDKTGLGYDGQMNGSDLNDLHVNESEVLNNVVDSYKSDRDDNQLNYRFKKGQGYHVVLPPYTGNYMPPRADLSFTGLDNFVFKSKASETITSVPIIETNASKTSKDSLENPKTVRNTTVENENKAEKPRKFSQSPRGNKINWNGLMTQKLGDGFESSQATRRLLKQINNVKNELKSDISNQTNELRNMLASYFQKNTASTPVNENYSAVILNKLPEKLGDPGKFLIPCDFPKLVECLALADLGASINLMPLFIWKNLSLPEITPTQMILALADQSTTRTAGIAKDIFVKVGKFHFPTDFVVVDYVIDPHVPLIIGRPFLRTGRALIDVYGEELTL